MNEIDVVRDISRKFELAGISLATGYDRAYLERWTRELGLATLLEECLND